MAKGACGTENCGAHAYCKGMCKPCYRRAWYVAHREHERATCADWYQRNADKRRADWQVYFAENADDLRAAKRRRYYDDHEAALAQKAQHRDKNRERYRERSRRQYAKDRDKRLAQAAQYRAANAELIKERTAERKRANPEKFAMWNRENARRRRVGIDGKPVDYAAILAEHGMTCHICGGEIESLADLHMDHVIPISRGGAHSAENIRPSHAICNQRKGARIVA